MNDVTAMASERLSPGQLERFASAKWTSGPHCPTSAEQRGRPWHRLFSVKGGCRALMCEGALRADAVMMAEGDPDVASLTETPVRIAAPLGSRPHYTFALAVVHRSSERETLYAVVGERELSLSDDGRQLPRYWRAIEAWCERNGRRCAYLTDRDIEAYRTRIDNWRALVPLVRSAVTAPNPSLEQDVRSLFEESVALSFADLPGQFPRQVERELEPIAARLLHEGYLDARLDDEPFTRYSPMTLRHVPRA